MNYFEERIGKIDFQKEKAWKKENIEEFGILLSAPSCYIHHWNLNYMEIDSIDREEMDSILRGLNFEKKEEIYEYYDYWFDNAAGADYEQFASFWNGEPCFDLEALSSDGQEAFTMCKNFAENFKDLVGRGGLYGWDYSEIIQVIRLGFMKEWLSYQEAGELLAKVAEAAYEKFDSWKEFAISFVCGGAYSVYKERGFSEEEFHENYGYEAFDSMCNVIQELFSDAAGEYWNLPLQG